MAFKGLLNVLLLYSAIYGTAQLQGNECSRVTREFLACHSHVSRVSLARITRVTRV